MTTPRELKNLYESGKNISQLLRTEKNLNHNSSEIIERAYDLQTGSYIEAMNDTEMLEQKNNYTDRLAKIILELGEPESILEAGVGEATTLSGVLKSPRAIEVSINIMDAFVHMRQYLLSHAPKQELEELRKRIEYLEEDISSDRESYEKQFDDLFTAFAKLSAAIQIKQTPLDRVKIEGFKNK